MNKKEAIDILIGLAACSSITLNCEDDCPFFTGWAECKHEHGEDKIRQAVKLLREGKKDE